MSEEVQPPEEVVNEEDYESSGTDEWAAPPRNTIEEAEAKAIPMEEMGDEERELYGEPVPVEFVLPDGTTLSHTFHMGHTVEYLKMLLDDRKQMAYHTTVLKLDGCDEVLIDPLSLNDLPFKAGEKNVVFVSQA